MQTFFLLRLTVTPDALPNQVNNKPYRAITISALMPLIMHGGLQYLIWGSYVGNLPFLSFDKALKLSLQTFFSKKFY